MITIISFKDVDIGYDGMIRCAVHRNEQQSDFYIRLPYSFRPEPDLVAAAFAAIVGDAFDEVHIDLPLGAEHRNQLENATRSRIVSLQGVDRRRKLASNSALNFSGGFDSLAAQVLEPCAELVSLDFGGRFSRERKFFERFDPYIFETNLVDLRLNRFAWTFMGIGSLLLRDELDIGTYSFGSIMAESAETLARTSVDQQTLRISPADYFGMRVANPVAGLSEVASMKLVALARPDLLIGTLMSVALPQEEKFLRKHQMLAAVIHDLGLEVELADDLPQRPKGMEWGYSRASDLASLYTISRLGAGKVLQYYPDGVPTHFLEFAEKNSLGFMNRVNPHAYAGTTPEQVAVWYSTLMEYGLRPFERRDWHGMTATMRLFD